MKIDVSKIQASADKLKKQMDKIQKEYQKNAKTLIGEVFGEYLRAYPHIHSLYWTQYTPYFNDGESCEFSVRDLCVVMKDEIDEDGEYDYDYNDLSYLYKEYTTDALKEAESWLQTYLEWEKDKDSYARANVTHISYEKDNILRSRFGYGWRQVASLEEITRAENEALEKLVSRYVPHYKYQSSQEVQEEIEKIQSNIESYQSFGDDSSALIKAFNSIGEDAMYSLYGDHIKIEVKLKNDKEVLVIVEEYEHD